MTEKRSKYDTDPLDPEFVRGTEQIGGTTRPTPSEEAKRDPRAEDPTRRFYEPPQAAQQQPFEQFSGSYPSVFVPPVYQPPPAGYTSFGADSAPPQQPATPPRQAYAPAPQLKPTQRPVAKLGIPENFALALPYVPFYIGLVAALVELILVPRTETRVRFHAAQGLALHIVILVGAFVFNLIEAVTDFGLGGTIFWLASLVFLVISIVRVLQGQPHHIQPLDDLTRKLNEKIEPRK